MIRAGLLATLLFAFSAGAAAPDEKPQASTLPKDLPIELKIVSHAELWELDTRGDRPVKFREKIRESEKGGYVLSATRVELELEIKNKGRSPISVWIDGDSTLLTFDLKGPGAMTADTKQPRPRGFIQPQAVTILPRASYKIPLTDLGDGFRLSARHNYITEIGDYELTATFKTGVSPVPPGSRSVLNGFGEVTLKSAPIKFYVKRPS